MLYIAHNTIPVGSIPFINRIAFTEVRTDFTGHSEGDLAISPESVIVVVAALTSGDW